MDAFGYIRNLMYNNLDTRKPIIATFLDTAKVFDIVNHP